MKKIGLLLLLLSIGTQTVFSNTPQQDGLQDRLINSYKIELPMPSEKTKNRDQISKKSEDNGSYLISALSGSVALAASLMSLVMASDSLEIFQSEEEEKVWQGLQGIAISLMYAYIGTHAMKNCLKTMG